MFHDKRRVGYVLSFLGWVPASWAIAKWAFVNVPNAHTNPMLILMVSVLGGMIVPVTFAVCDMAWYDLTKKP